MTQASTLAAPLTTATIKALRNRVAKWLHIPPEDADVIDFILAVLKSNEMPGDPLWGLIIDASGGGKTELLRALRKRSDAYFLSGLTEKSLVSGYRDPNNPRQDPSLLPQLHGKVLIIKDLSPLLSMRRESRNAILADLRDAYDGFTDQGRGNLGRTSYEAKFSVLAASTLAVERFDKVDQELGERFVKFRMRGSQTSAKVRQAIRNVGRDDSMRVEIEKTVSEYLDSLPKARSVILPRKFEEALTTISDFTATARSHVPRDRRHNLLYQPRAEVGTRVGKELAKLLQGLAIVRGRKKPNTKDLKMVARVAEDSLPPNRLGVLRVLRASDEPQGVAQIATACGLHWSTTKQTLEDLQVLGLATSTSTDGDGKWRLAPVWGKQLENLPLLV